MVSRPSQKGFTLIELLVVISIIALLSSVVLASLNTARQKARNTQRMSDMRQVITALELYRNDNGAYPTVTANTDTNWRSQCTTWGGYANNVVIPGLVPTYISVLPKDPLMVPSTSNYCYIYRSDGSGYVFLDHASNPQVWNDGPVPTNYFDPQRPTWAWKTCVGTTQCAW